MPSAASHRRRARSGDPDIAPERGGRPRRDWEPARRPRVTDDDEPVRPERADRADPSAGPADPADRARSVEGLERREPAEPTGPELPPGATGEAGTAATEPAADPAAGRSRRFRRHAGKRPKKKAPWWELPVLIVVAILVAILVKTFLIQPFYIPSASMEKTLHGCDGCSGDRIIVNKPVYTVFRDPHPGDIVVFKAPPGWQDEVSTTSPSGNPVVKGLRWFGQLVGVVPPDEEDLVKRVIAIGGQTVKCCDADGNVQVSDNGPGGPFHSLDDASFVFEDPGSAQFGQLPFGPVTVPKDRLWVMGDHRNNSEDSRYHCGDPPSPDTAVCSDGSQQTAVNGTVPVDDVIGKAVIIAWPPSRWTTLGTPKTFASVPLPSSMAASPTLAALATVGPLGIGLLSAGGFGGWRRRRRRPRPRA